MQPYLGLNAKMLGGALAVLAIALFIPFSSYINQQRTTTTSQANIETSVAQTSVILAQHKFECTIAEPQNGIIAGTGCNDIKVGQIFAVDVQIRSDIDASSLVNLSLNYANSKIIVQKIIIDGQLIEQKNDGSSPKVAKEFFIDSWVTQNFDNTKGEVQLIGSVPNPGFITLKGSSPAVMARLYFKAVSAGESEISINNTSGIYRNADDENILVNKQNLRFIINQ
jgi:hypothetical protein